MDSFVVTLSIAQINVDVQHIYLVRSTLEYGVIIWDPYLQSDIDKIEVSRRLLVLSAAITNLGTVAVFHECSRTLNCHFYKRSNSD